MRMKTLLLKELRRNLEQGGRPNLPAGSGLLWSWFSDLCGSRTYHGAGLNALSYLEIEAYFRITKWPVEPRHVVILMAMDQEFIAFTREGQQARANGVKTLPPKSPHIINDVLFDSMFGE